MLGIQLVCINTGLAIFTGVLMSTQFFWDMVPWKLVYNKRCFEGDSCFYRKGLPSSPSEILHPFPTLLH